MKRRIGQRVGNSRIGNSIVMALLLGAIPTAALAHRHEEPAPAPVPVVTTNAPIDAAVASSRPADDTARDDSRLPRAMLAFAGVKPGDTVIELMPGGGYFTRILSPLVGTGGKDYVVIPATLATAYPQSGEKLKALAEAQPLGNVVPVINSVTDFGVPQQADVAWTTENYHDLYGLLGPDGTEAYVRAVFAALKPGGIFLISDHVALPGTSATAPTTRHRIDPETVKAQLLAAGFLFDGESDMLENLADDHTLKVFDPAIRGKTDQFVFRFKKPAG